MAGKMIYSKLVGTSFGECQENIARAKLLGIKTLHLERDYHNGWDPHCIRAIARTGEGDLFLGHIPNPDVECAECGKLYPRMPMGRDQQPKCAVCGKEKFNRVGLATQISKAIAEGASFVCEISDYTGGTDGKHNGVNIKIVKLEIERPQAA